MAPRKPAARTSTKPTAKPAAKPAVARRPRASAAAAADAASATSAPAATAGSIPAPAFPIVGIGASAGGLEAFEAFFRACPADTGMAFVLVPHLDPGHQSMLTEILQRAAAMPVLEALDQIAVAPDHVYVIPPNREMAILGGVLLLSVPELVRGHRMPIDGFLRSLAEDRAERAIGIILSGTASDGTWACAPSSAAAVSAWCRNPPPPNTTACRAARSRPATPPTSCRWNRCRRCWWKSPGKRSTASTCRPSPRKRRSPASTRSCCNCAAPLATTSRSTRKAPSAAASSAAWRGTPLKTRRCMRASSRATRPRRICCTGNC